LTLARQPGTLKERAFVLEEIMRGNRHPLLAALLVVVAVTAVQALLVPLFDGPAANAKPSDLPVIVAGPPPAADAFSTRLETAQPGAFDISQATDGTAADQALRDREAYAAFVLDTDGVALHLASAASPAVATLLREMARDIGDGQPVPVIDVMPASPDDPRGAGFATGFLPLVLTSMMAGILLMLLAPGRPSRLIGLAAYPIAAGLVTGAVLGPWLGVLGGDYLANAAVIGLIGLAVSATVTGLGAVLGNPGIGLGVLLVFLIGNPLSAASAAPELLPQPWGQLGQLLPPGAGGTLLRSVAWFDGAGAGAALWTLLAWAGLAMIVTAFGSPENVRRPDSPIVLTALVSGLMGIVAFITSLLAASALTNTSERLAGGGTITDRGGLINAYTGGTFGVVSATAVVLATVQLVHQFASRPASLAAAGPVRTSRKHTGQ
jgi:hypothetical protein